MSVLRGSGSLVAIVRREPPPGPLPFALSVNRRSASKSLSVVTSGHDPDARMGGNARRNDHRSRRAPTNGGGRPAHGSAGLTGAVDAPPGRCGTA